MRPAPASAPFGLAPAPGPLGLPAAALQDTGLEAGDGLTVTPGLPLSPNGSVIPAVFTDLPASGALPDEPLDEEAVRISQDRTAASNDIPPGVEVVEVLPGPSAPAPAPAPFGYLAPNAAPSGGLAPSRRGRRLLGFFDDVAGLFTPSQPPQKPTFTTYRIKQNTLDVYPRNLGLVYRALSPSNYTLFDSFSGPRIRDVDQTGLGDCWLQSAMVSVLDNGGPIKIRDVYGDFKTFEMIFRVRERVAYVITDSQVLFRGSQPWTNAVLVDVLSNKGIVWPLLWTKAYAILATRFPELVSEGDDSRPCRGGWCDMIGGQSYLAVLPHTGRPGYVYYFKGNIAAKQLQTASVSLDSDSDALSKLFKRQAKLEVLGTLSNKQLRASPRFNNATKSVDVGIYTLQIADKDDSLYSVRHRRTNLTFVLCFGHAYSVSLNADRVHLDVANPWGDNPTLTAEGKEGPRSSSRYIRRIPVYVVEFIFLRLHYG